MLKNIKDEYLLPRPLCILKGLIGLHAEISLHGKDTGRGMKAGELKVAAKGVGFIKARVRKSLNFLLSSMSVRKQ